MICSVGAATTEYRSFAEGQRDFDLCLIAYEPGVDVSAAGAEYVLQRPGYKFPNARCAVGNFGLLERYDYFWLPDADLTISSAEVSELFAIARQFSLDVSQPALKRLRVPSNHYTWEITLACPGSLLRYTDFVEIMCPLFSAQALGRLLWTFDLGCSGWGLDVLWPRVLNDGRFAIVDTVNVEHASAVASGSWHLPNGLTPDQELSRIFRDHGLQWPSPRVLGRAPTTAGPPAPAAGDVPVS